METEKNPPAEDNRSLLIVEDDQRFADTLAAEFRDRGYSVEWLESLREVQEHPTLDFRYAVVDLRIRQDSGLDVISCIKERAPDAVIIVLTGYGSIATAVKATKLGATAYLTKPVDADEIERALTGEDTEEDVPIPDEFQSLYRHEREYIEYVLAECDGNISQAARRLGLHRQSLQRKLRKYTPN
ncbi:MAG: response regulator [Myxococcota bacterium]|nr:response regulator [Myxococcota bacterium]